MPSTRFLPQNRTLLPRSLQCPELRKTNLANLMMLWGLARWG